MSNSSGARAASDLDAQVEQRFPGSGGEIVDTAIAELTTLGAVAHRSQWIVSVGVPGTPATVWVDTRTHAALRVRYDIAARSLSFTDERITPLHG